MTTVLITGANGFIGKHLVEALGRRPDTRVFGYDLGIPEATLEQGLLEADVIYHLAGVNRPQNPDEFRTGNTGFTEQICSKLKALGRTPSIVMTSSIQAALDNPYGISKRQAELALEEYAAKCASLRPPSSGSSPLTLSPYPFAIIFRLKNVFGKWCRPNYNSVTATFCHNIAHNLPITISDPARELELVYIDDVIHALTSILYPPTSDLRPPTSYLSYREVERSFKVTLGDLAAKIRSFRESRTTLKLPAMDDAFTRCLYATYLSYLDGPEFSYELEIKTDPRGSLAEFMKSVPFGQIFVSRTKPGITRGNHYHHTKTEKFLVVEGDAIIRFRKIAPCPLTSGPSPLPLPPLPSESSVIEHRVSGREFKVVDIPPGYTHSIENIGNTEMVVLFWASEIFDQTKPDTFPAPVMG
jgi:UDP-2-acetamido-2,6-beta-L-arabino-hexul-4-ose reductase